MPRKSAASAAAQEESVNAKAASKDDGLNIEDLNLPKSIVARLAKGVLPPNTQIQKDAVLAMSKSATVFVNYLTSHAAENAARSGKKTVMPQDVFEAMGQVEFDFFLPRLEAEVNKFTSIQADKRNTYRKKIREEKKAGTQTPTVGATPQASAEAPAAADSPPTKRARRSSVDNGEHQTGSEEEGDADEAAEDVPDEEDDEEEEDEVEEEAADEGLTEDPLEVRESEPSDDEMADGNDSD